MTRERQDQSMFRGQGPPSPGDGSAQGPGLSCLEPARFWKAALAGVASVFTPVEREHLNHCPLCQKRFEQVVKAVQSAATDTPSQEDEDRAITEVPAEQPLHRLVGNQACAPAVPFDNGLLAQLIRRPDGTHWLKIEHPEKLPILALQVRIHGPGLAIPWQRFVLLVPQRERSEALVSIEDATPPAGQEHWLFVQPIEEELPCSCDLPLWRSSFAMARRDTPEAMLAWRSWVDSLPNEAAEPEVKAFLKQVRRGEMEPAVIVVCGQGRGQFTTLNAAIQQAEPGSRIKVRPGLYREDVVLDRPLEIQGDPSRRELVVIEGVRGPALRVEARHGKVRGLTLRGQRTAAVEVPRGGVIFEDCAIGGGSVASVWVHGVEATPLFVRCRMHHSAGAGVLFHDRARGRLEDCEIFGNEVAGVEINLGADPLLFRCLIHGNSRHGVLVSDSGRGVLEDCHLSGHRGADVTVCFEGSVSLSQCLLREGPGSGVLLRFAGEALVAGCSILHHGGVGVDVGDGCVAALTRCRVNGNKRGDLIREGDARVKIEDCVGITEALSCPIP